MTFVTFLRCGHGQSGKFKEHLIESVGCGQLPAIERDDCILDAINVLLDDHAGASWPIDTGAKLAKLATNETSNSTKKTFWFSNPNDVFVIRARP